MWTYTIIFFLSNLNVNLSSNKSSIHTFFTDLIINKIQLRNRKTKQIEKVSK